MTEQHDQAYYSERERQCRMMAEQAREPQARAAHLKLAALYARRAATAEDAEQRQMPFR